MKPEEVREWLLKEGAPLEMWAAARMREQGFLTNQSTYFRDPKTNEYRELDIEAGRRESIARDGRAVGEASWHVIVECKFSADPWVAFVVEGEMRGLAWSLLRPTTRLGELLLIDCDRTGERTRAFAADVQAYGLLRKPPNRKGGDDLDKRDPAFAATQKLCAAALKEINEDVPRPTAATFVYPILVLEAQLMAASLGDDGSPYVKEIQSAVVTSPPTTSGRRVSILVVTKEAFPEAIRRVREEMDLLQTEGRSRLGQLSKELADRINAQGP